MSHPARLPRLLLAATPSSASRKFHVLVAEDNEVNQEIMLQMLESLGVTADVVSDGNAAIEALARRAYPLVLMDCQMPTLDGYQATRAIREKESGRDGVRIPIIAVTAHALAGEREKVLEAGMDDYVTKPVTVEALAAALGRVLGEVRVDEPRCPPSPPVAAAASVDKTGRLSEEPFDPTVTRSAKVARLFLKFVPAQLDDLAHAAARGDADALQAAAHKLKGSCAGVGVRRMGALAKLLEGTAPADAAAHIATLRAEFEIATSALETELSENRAV